MLFLRNILFLLLIVATVVGYLPFLITRFLDFSIDLGFFRYAGIILIFPGMLLLFSAILSFALQGKGTPAIFFTRPFRKIIGEEPANLLSKGIYTFSRNPMYLGVVLITAGESILFEQPFLLLYSCLVFLAFHLVIIYLEEPHLEKKHGNSYIEFLNKTRRWI